jgi:hypothetical protein
VKVLTQQFGRTLCLYFESKVLHFSIVMARLCPAKASAGHLSCREGIQDDGGLLSGWVFRVLASHHALQYHEKQLQGICFIYWTSAQLCEDRNPWLKRVGKPLAQLLKTPQ